VAIFGHSRGSALGVLYAVRFPEKVAAYVGSGQIGDWAAGESASYAFALAEARRLGKRRAVKKLRAIGPPPDTADSLWTQRTWLSRLEGRMAHGSEPNRRRSFPMAVGSTVDDAPRARDGREIVGACPARPSPYQGASTALWNAGRADTPRAS
jgi:pimeloyl-ACP methyl ester carboxylesterase